MPPDLTGTTWKTEWIARVCIGLVCFAIALGVIGSIHWVVIRGIPPSQVGIHPFSLGYADASGGSGREPGLEDLRAVDQRLDRELASVANLLHLVIARLTTLEGRTNAIERALTEQGELDG